jgi:hypothetical protein
VRPVFVDLRPGRGEVRARNRRAVRNYIEPVVPVDVLDERATLVVHAITMWLSPRPARRAPGGAPAAAPPDAVPDAAEELLVERGRPSLTVRTLAASLRRWRSSR